MKGLFTKEAKIGIVTIVSLVLLYIGINYLKGINLFKPANHYYVACTNVKGVTISTPVFVEGFKVGLVREIKYDYQATNKITIEISLDDDMRINKGSYVTLVNTFLSGGEMHIHLNKYTSEYMKPGDVLEGRSAEDMMSSVSDNILPQVEQLLPKIDSILTGLQALVSNQAIGQSLNNLQVTTGNLASTSRQLNLMMGHDVPVILGNLKTISGNMSEVSTNLTKLDFANTLNKVNRTLDNIQQMTERFNSKDNSLGLLLNDRTLYDNLNITTQNASNLLLDLKEHPKRYIHISVF